MLQIQNLSVAYGRRPIIHDLSAGPLLPGRVVSLLGPNGSGKSTLLKALAGLLKVAHGQVMLDGQDLTKLSFERRAQRVVYLPQSLPAAVHLRVFESVMVAARASDLDPRAQDASQRVDDGRFSRAGRACYADEVRPPGMRVERGQGGVRIRRAVFDAGDQARERAAITGEQITDPVLSRSVGHGTALSGPRPRREYARRCPQCWSPAQRRR